MVISHRHLRIAVVEVRPVELIDRERAEGLDSLAEQLIDVRVPDGARGVQLRVIGKLLQ